MLNIIGYIIFGLVILLYLWALSVWWRFNKWIAISIPLIFILTLIAGALN